MTVEFSVVVPVFNEEGSIDIFIQELYSSLKALQISFEIIFVDDGSTDKTLSRIAASGLEEIKVISFTKNFGHMQALSAGYSQASGLYVGTMDGDLQHPVDTLLEMFSLIKTSGLDCVVAFQESRTDTRFLKRRMSKIFYQISSLMAGVRVVESAADFRIVSRRVVDDFNLLKNRDKFFRLLIPKLGYSTAYIPYMPEKRIYGESKYTLSKMIRLALKGFKEFSIKPLYWILIAGGSTCVLGLIWMLYATYEWTQNQATPGWTSIVCALVVFSGVQIFSIGIVGIYIAEITELVRNRQEFTIKRL